MDRRLNEYVLIIQIHRSDHFRVMGIMFNKPRKWVNDDQQDAII